MHLNTLTYARSVSTNSKITLRNFSASVSCLDGVSIAFDIDDATDPVGLDFLVSCGDRQKPVTFKHYEKDNWIIAKANHVNLN